MTDQTELLIIIGGFSFAILTFGIIIAVMVSRGKKHARKVRMLADMRGFKYEGKDLDHVLRDGKGCYPFVYFNNWKYFEKKGVGHKVYHVMRKTFSNGTITICDYTLSRRSAGGSSVDYLSYTLMIIVSPDIQLPDFVCAPPKGIPTLEVVPGFEQDIEIPHLQDYVIKGKNPDAIKHLFNNNVIGFIQRNHELTVEGHPGKLLCYFYKGIENWNFATIDDWEQLVTLEHDCIQLFCS